MKTQKTRTLLFIASMGMVLTTWTLAVSGAADVPNISTTTGVVSLVEEDRCILSIYGMTFFPSEKVAKKSRGERGPIPDWVKPGAEVSVSYYVSRGNRYYLDVVRPGERFLVKEELEEARNTPQ